MDKDRVARSDTLHSVNIQDPDSSADSAIELADVTESTPDEDRSCFARACCIGDARYMVACAVIGLFLFVGILATHFYIAPTIAQGMLDQATCHLDSLYMSDPENNTIRAAIASRLYATVPLDSKLTAPTVTMYYAGLPLATMEFPEVTMSSKDKVHHLDINTTLHIQNLTLLGQLGSGVLGGISEPVTLVAKASVTVYLPPFGIPISVHYLTLNNTIAPLVSGPLKIECDTWDLFEPDANTIPLIVENTESSEDPVQARQRPVIRVNATMTNPTIASTGPNTPLSVSMLYQDRVTGSGQSNRALGLGISHWTIDMDFDSDETESIGHIITRLLKNESVPSTIALASPNPVINAMVADLKLDVLVPPPKRIDMIVGAIMDPFNVTSLAKDLWNGRNFTITAKLAVLNPFGAWIDIDGANMTLISNGLILGSGYAPKKTSIPPYSSLLTDSVVIQLDRSQAVAIMGSLSEVLLKGYTKFSMTGKVYITQGDLSIDNIHLDASDLQSCAPTTYGRDLCRGLPGWPQGEEIRIIEA